jgi:hypothetical protein
MIAVSNVTLHREATHSLAAFNLVLHACASTVRYLVLGETFGSSCRTPGGRP